MYTVCGSDPRTEKLGRTDRFWCVDFWHAAYSMLLVLTDWYLTLPSFRLKAILTQSDRLLINKMYNFANCKVTIYLAELVAQALIDELVC